LKIIKVFSVLGCSSEREETYRYGDQTSIVAGCGEGRLLEKNDNLENIAKAE
jgi:hypothetical protein